MSANKDDTLKQFCDVTGADEARSRFFLESSNWQLEVALSSFYEHGGSADEAPSNPSAAPVSLPMLSDSDMDSPPGSPLHAQKKEQKQTTNTRFATLGSLQQQESSSDEEEEKKRKVQFNYYGDEAGCSKQEPKEKKSKELSKEMDNDMNNPDELKKEIERLETENRELRKEIARLYGIQDESEPEKKRKLRKLRLRKWFCDEVSCSKKKPKDKKPLELSKETDKDMNNPDELKRKLERLRAENRELRKEIARLNGTQDESDQGQAFYAGGSERSGQQILGPGKNRKDIVTEMFKSVRERGAVVFEDEPSTTSRGRGAFSGVGYRLGQTSDDHEPVTASGNQPQEQARSVRLRLYREGFTVDSGPLRHYTDPENADFLSCIRRGEIPPELSAGGAGGAGGAGEVRVSLEDRRHEACPRTQSRTHAFAGKGQMLGSPTPPTVGATAPVASDANDRAANQRAAQTAVNLDESKPVTTIQFRLADGSRLTGRFNHTHTIADLQQYVSRAEPTYQLVQFALLTGYPSAELSDPTVTLVQANLLNSTLLQRLK